MSKKQEILSQWLEWAMIRYDGLNASEQRALFEHTCKRAGQRFTAKELEHAIENIKFWIERERSNGYED